MPISRDIQQRIAWGVLLGLLGFAGNWFKFELFFNVDFLFGSLFVMLAIMRFGILSGFIAGSISAGCTILLWHHPWAVIVLLAETGLVAWLFHKKQQDCLTADMIFWLFIGAPLVWLLYHHVLHIGSQSSLLITLKQAINGVFNALVASAIHLTLRIRSSDSRNYPSFREILFITMLSIILFPSFIYLTLKVRDETRIGQVQISEAAEHTSMSARSAMDQWLKVHHQDVKLLATLVGSPSKTSLPQMQYYVEQVRKASPAFLRMGVLDSASNTIAYSPLMQNGMSNIGVNFADRPYIPLLQSTLQPHIPDMVPGKLATKVPILPLLVPMADKNGYAGFCVGIADLSLIRKLLSELVTNSNENITVLDRNENVVVSTRNDLSSMAHFQRPTGATVRPISDGYFHWIPEVKQGSSIMTRWMKSVYVRETLISKELPWKIFVELSPIPMLTKLTENSINAFLMMGTIIVLSFLFARFISNTYVAPLQLLELETQHIPDVLDSGIPVYKKNSSRIQELYGLNENFHQMTRILHDRMREVHSANQAHLASVEKEKTLLHEKEMLVKDLHDGIGGLLTKISMLAQYAKANNTFESYNEITDKILVLAYEGGGEVRSFMNSLESEETAWGDLLAELTEHAERMLEHSNTELSVASVISPQASGVGVFRYVNIVRIFREVVANIVKHAGARDVCMRFIVTPESFELHISDDGIGYDVASIRKRGVANMYGRATLLGAKLVIETPPGGGTRVALTIPLNQPVLEQQCA